MSQAPASRSRSSKPTKFAETQSNEAGGFNLSTIKAGTYWVSISKNGFKAFHADNIQVNSNTAVRVDASLQVGAQNQSVEVKSESAILQTERADVHGEFTSKALVDLPQPTRTFMGVVALMPGITPPGASSGGNNNPGKSMAIRANGTSSAGTAVRIECRQWAIAPFSQCKPTLR